MRGVAVLALGFVLLSGAAVADAGCGTVSHEGLSHTVCEAEAGAGDVRLWLRDGEGAVFGSFERLSHHLEAQGQRLVFAMNAGMYHPDRQPVGLYVEDGQRETALVTSSGPGNFGMLPNGVFCVGEDRFAVIESRYFADAAPDCRHASQSGPLLVIDGSLHPRFLRESTSRYVRNGVGVSEDGRHAWFVISDQPVTFHEFARVFRDVLGASDALYFDGNVSRLHAPAIGRSDMGRRMGPIVGLAVPR